MPCPRSSTLYAAAVLAVASTFAVTRPASAQQVQGFFERTAWDAALLTRDVANVYGLPPAPDDSTVYGPMSPLSLAAGGRTVTAGGPGFAIVGQLADDRGRPATVRPGAPAYRIDLSFSTPITAFGADYLPNTGTAGTGGTGTQLFTLSAPGLGTYNLSTSETGWRFFGITSDTPFSSATIIADGPIYYDQATVGDADPAARGSVARAGLPLVSGAVYALPMVTAVPEPSLVALTVTGLAGLAGVRLGRRARHRA